ncbi:MAG TPA: hypothetical protein VLJ76_02500 [Gaiellaceae bacterium]|nr:hypothetical protein [Gaiellaceae bacterium]
MEQPLSQRLREIREAQLAEAEAETPPEPESDPESELEFRTRAPLGRALVEKGVISEDDVDAALERQRLDGRPLGQILVEMGAVAPQTLARALTESHGFDAGGSLRARLVEESSVDPPDDDPGHDRYVIFDTDPAEPLHVADSFVDAADAAFELIDDRDLQSLQIARVHADGFEHVWSYRPDEPAAPASV